MKTIEQIRAEVETSVAKAEAAESGPWIVCRDDGLDCLDLLNTDGKSIANIGFLIDSDPHNFEHIADARTAVPRMGRMLLAALRAAEEWSLSNGDHLRPVESILQAIQEAEETP